jgi:poly(A) polymerase
MILKQAEQLAYKAYCQEELRNVTKEEVLALSSDDLSLLHFIMIGPHVGLALAALQKVGFFSDLIPEIQDGLDLKSSHRFKEIWPHTIRVVSQTPPFSNVRWAALFHDLGKAKAFGIKGGKVTFHHHEHISAVIFDRFARRTRIFSDGQRRSIRFLVANLGYVENYDSTWTDSAVRRFDKEMNIFLNDLLTLSKADITTSKPENRNRILRRIQNLEDRIARVREQDAKKSPLPKGIGTAIADSLGISLGPEIGKIKKELEEKVEWGELLPNEDIKYYIDYLKKFIVEEANDQQQSLDEQKQID